MEDEELKKIQNLAKIKINILNPYAMIAEAMKQELSENIKQEKPLQRNGSVI